MLTKDELDFLRPKVWRSPMSMMDAVNHRQDGQPR